MSAFVKSPPFLLPLLLLVPAIAISQDKPRAPFYSWGACPFECCIYREWQAEEPVVAYARRDLGSPVTFRVQKGEWVEAVNGVVITHAIGVSKVLKPVELGYGKNGNKPLLSLKAGDLLYPLHYLGEGSYLFGYQGFVYSDQVSGSSVNAVLLPDRSIEVLVPPKYVWWAKIRSKQGILGWTNTPNRFGNTDRCG